MADVSPTNGPATKRGGLMRLVPLLVVAVLMALAFGMGWHKYLSFQTIGLNYDRLQQFIQHHLVWATLLYVGAYIGVVALSLPIASLMTPLGGLLFGWQLGAPAAIIGATIGATLVFLVARTALGEALAARAGPWLAKLRDGFKENALSYMLFLRLVPVFPFWLVNLAPALLGVPLRTFVIGTFLGILPAATAFAVAGSGLGSVVEAQNQVYKACLAKASAGSGGACTYAIDASALVTKELVAAFALLGLVALIPVAIKKWSKPDAD